MANEVLLKAGTQLSFADHAGDFSPAAGNSLEQGTPTDVQLSLASIADAASRQSAKVDLGATRARTYEVIAAIEFAATPTAGELVHFYWAPSPDATAANGNPGGCSGSDAAYAGYSSNMADSLRQLMHVGVMEVTVQVTTTVQIARCGRFQSPTRYGSLVVRNESGASFHSDDVESHVIIEPIIDEVQ